MQSHPPILDHRIEAPRLTAKPRSRFFRPIGLRALLATALLGLFAGKGQAAPKGERVTAGSASFDRDGNITRIRASDGTIINYSSFDVGKSETVRFIQPNSSSRVLNRIGGGNPTSIFGTIQANGVVYLVNPSGIYFRDGSMVNVGMLYAAAGSISDTDFLAGRDHFTQIGSSVINAGTINSVQDTYLIGANVANYGSITSQTGTVMMVAGSDVLLGPRDGNVFVAANPKAGVAGNAATPGVDNQGTVTAKRAIMGAGDLYSIAISNSGLVKAPDIQLRGGATGIVNVSGTLDASSQTPGTTGGSVKIEGEKIALRAATVDASGPAGGGTVLIGGGPKGTGDTRHASQTIVDAASVIKADATVKGNGGNVVVWSDQYTQFYGTLSAKGGTLGGNGGNAEISGAQSLTAKGTVDLSAPMGQLGTLTYDPANIVITGGTADGSDAGDATSGTLKNNPGSNTSGTVDFVDEGTSAPADFVVTESEIEGTLLANIVLEARNSITTSGTFTNGLAITGTKSVTIETRNDASLGDGMGGIDLSGVLLKTSLGGSVIIKSGATGAAGTAPVIVGSIDTGGLGTVSISAQGALTQAAGNVITSPGVTLNAGTTIGSLAAPVNIASGATLSSTSGGNQFLQSAGSVSLSGLDAGTGTVMFTAGTFNLGASNIINDATSLSINGSTATLGIASQNELVAGVILDGGGSITGLNGVLSSSSAFDLRYGSVTAILGGTHGLTKTTSQGVTLSGVNTYTGQTLVSGGSLILGHDNVFANGSTLKVDSGGTLNLNGHTDTVNGVSLTGGTISGTGALTSTTAFDIQSGTASAVLAGTAGLTKSTGGSATLSGANTYTGQTLVNGGTLSLGADNVLANASTLKVDTGGTFDVSGHTDTVNGVSLTGGTISGAGTLTSTTAFDLQSGTASSILAGSAGLTKSNTGTATLSGANTYTGQTLVNGGTLSLGADNVLANASNLKVDTGGTFDLNGHSETVNGVSLTGGTISGAGTLTSSTAFDVQAGSISAILAGSAGLTKSNSGTVTLTGANTYTGGTQVNAGTLILGASEVLVDTGDVTVNGGTFTVNGTETIAKLSLLNGTVNGTGTLIGTSAYDARSGTISVILGGSSSLIKTTAGTVTLSGTNTYSGTTQILGGTLALGKDNVLSDASDVEIDNGSTFSVGTFKDTVSGVLLNSGTIDGSAGGVLTSNSLILLSGTVNAVLKGTGGLTKDGSGQIVVNSTGNNVGNVTVADGTLSLGANNAFVSSTTVTINGAAGGGKATFDLNNFNQTLGGITFVSPVTGGASSTLNLGTGTLSLGGDVSVINNSVVGVQGGVGVTINSAAGGKIDLQGQTRTFTVQGQVYGTPADMTINAPIVNGKMIVNGISDSAGGAAVIALGVSNNSSQPFTLQVAQGRLVTLVSGALSASTNLLLGTDGVATAGVVDLNGTSQTVNSIGLAAGNLGGTNNQITSNVAGGGGALLTVSSTTTNSSFGGAITGLTGLTKDGAGTTLTLTQTNTFSGNATVLGGTLALANTSNPALGTNNVFVNGTNATLLLQADNQITSQATVTVQSGIFDLGTHSDLIDHLVLSGGTVNGSGILSSTTNFILQSGTINAELGGASGVTKNTGGLVTINHSASYLSGTTIEAGTLAITTDHALGNGASTVTVQVGGTLDLQNVNLTTGYTINLAGTLAASTGTSSLNSAVNLQGNSIISVGGTKLTLNFGLNDSGNNFGINKTGAGLLLLNNLNFYGGHTVISAGTIGLGLDNALPTTTTLDMSGSSAVLELNGHSQQVAGVTGHAGTSGIIDNNGAAATFTINNSGANSFAGVFSGALALRKLNGGTLTLGGASTYTGSTWVAAGTLQLEGGSNRLPTTTHLILGDDASNSAGVLDLNGQSQEVAGMDSLGFSGANRVINTGSTSPIPVLTLNIGTGTTSNFGGILGLGGADGFGLTKTGGGTLQLSGVNTYTGLTNVNGGILAVASNTALGSAAPTSGTVVANGGTLQISGGINLTESLSISGAGAPGTTGALENVSGANTLVGSLTLNGNGKVAVDAGSSLTFQGPVNGSGGLLLSIDTGSFAKFLSGVGATVPLSTFSVSGAGSLLLGGTVNVQGGDVTIATPTTLVGDVAINSTGGITFTSAASIDSDSNATPRNLTLNADTDQSNNNDGVIDLAGPIGFFQRPNSLIFGSATDAIHLDNAIFRTVNGVTFPAPVTLGANLVIDTTNGAAIFRDTVTGAGHSLVAPHDAEFDGSVTGLTTLEVDGKALLAAPIISSTGYQRYKGAVTLGADTDIETTNSEVTFSSTVDGAHKLTVNTISPTGGAVTFSGVVGSITPLTGLTAAGDSVRAGAITTAGPIALTSQNLMSLNGPIDAGSGTVTIKVNQDGLGSDSFEQTVLSSITTTNNTAQAITIQVGGMGNVYLGSLTAGASGIVTVSAPGGFIVDNNNNTLNISGGGAVLTAGAGVGSAGDFIETAVGKIEGQGGTGGFYIDNGTTAFTVGGISAVDGISATGDIILKGGAMTLTEDLTSSSSVQLYSTGAINQTGGIVTAPALGIQAVSATFLNTNAIGTIAANITGLGQPFNFTVGPDLTIGTVGAAGAGGFLSGITTNGGDVNLTSLTGSLNIAQGIVAPGAAVTLTALTGQAKESGAGYVQAKSLETKTGSGTTLGGPNAVSIFKATSSGGTISLNNTITLSIAGISTGGNVDVTNSAQMSVDAAVTAGGTLALTTTSGPLILNADLTNQNLGMVLTASGQLNQKLGTITSGGLVKLISKTADILQDPAAKIVVAKVDTTSAHGASLLGQNTIQQFSAANSGTGDIVLHNSGDLEIGKVTQSGGALIVTDDAKITTTDPLTVSGGVSLTTTGAASDIIIGDKLTAGGVVKLVAPRNVITQGAVKSNGADLRGQIVDLKDNFLAGSGDLKIQASVEIYLEGTAYSGSNVLFNTDPTTVLPLGARATIIATNPALTTVTANSLFTVGFQQKFLSFGSLTIQGSTVTIGDLAAYNALTVNAGSIKLLDRQANGLSSGTAIDRGLNIVGRTINFTGSMSFAGTGNSTVSFATAEAPPSAPRIAGSTFYRDPNFEADFPHFTGLPSGGFTSVPALTTFPNMPIAGGIVDSQVVAVLAGVLPDTPIPDAAAEAQISAAVAAKLQSLGVNARDPDEEEKKDILRKRALFKQLVVKQGASDSEYKVVVNRITSSQVVTVLKKADNIFGANQEAKPAIEAIFRQTYSRYIDETSATDASGFGEYLTSHAAKDPQAAEAVRVVAQFRDLFGEIGKLGLTPKEMRISQNALGRALTIEGLSSSDFLSLVGVGQATKASTAEVPKIDPTLETPPPASNQMSMPVSAPARPNPAPAPWRAEPPSEYFREDLPPLPPSGSPTGFLGASNNQQP